MVRVAVRVALMAGAMTFPVVGCGGSDAEPDAGPPLVDRCTDPSDMALIESLEPDGGGAPGELVGVLGIVEDCGRGPCLAAILGGSDAEIDACMNTCLDGSEASGLSLGCRDCFVAFIYCAQDYCVLPCLSNEDPIACEACLQTNCYPPLATCEGF